MKQQKYQLPLYSGDIKKRRNSRSEEKESKPQVALRIHERLPELVPLPLLSFRAHIIVTKALDSFDPVVALQELGRSR